MGLEAGQAATIENLLGTWGTMTYRERRWAGYLPPGTQLALAAAPACSPARPRLPLHQIHRNRGVKGVGLCLAVGESASAAQAVREGDVCMPGPQATYSPYLRQPPPEDRPPQAWRGHSVATQNLGGEGMNGYHYYGPV